MRVSQFKGTTTVTKPSHRDLLTVLNDIKSGEIKAIISKLRLINDKTERNEKKKELLPMVTFGGTFKSRSNSQLIKASGMAMMDFDDVADVTALSNQINKDKYTFSSFVSPSGNGLKVLVKIPPVADDKTYKEYYFKLQEHFNTYAETDDSTKDLARGTYLSYDPDIFINLDSETFTDKFIAQEKPIVEQTNIPIQDQDVIAERLEKWFKKRYTATNRNTNLHAFARQMNAFGVSKDICEMYLLRYEESDFRANEIISLINSAYKYTQEWNTQAFEDEKTVRTIKNSVMAGNSESSIKQKIDLPSDKVSKEIEKHKAKLIQDEFWYYTDKDVIKMSSSRFKNYLQNNNISKYYPNEDSAYLFIKKDLDFIKLFDENRIKDFVLEDLENRSEIAAFEMCAESPRTFTPSFLSFLRTSEIEIQRDTKEEAYLYYRNTAVKITKDDIELVPYSDIKGLVWENQVIDRDFTAGTESEGEFKTFLWKVSAEDPQRYYSFKSVIGYLLHGYQNQGKPKVIIFNDEMISDVPNGGSGKGLIHKAIGHIKNLSTINGKGFDPNGQFAYQTLNTDTQVLLFDDIDRNFNFESLFSIVTEGLIIEKKGKDAIKIPFAESPKLSITTNYTVRGEGSSHARRVFEVEMSAYFNDKNTPEDEFGHLMFLDWGDDEWEKFDNYMMRCIQHYLKNGLVEYNTVNLDEKKLRNDTSIDFINFMDEQDFTSDTRWFGTELKDKFVDQCDDYKYKSWFTTQKFNKWLSRWVDVRPYVMNRDRANGRRYFTIEKVPF